MDRLEEEPAEGGTARSFCTNSEKKILRAVTKADGMEGVKRTLKFAGWM